MKAFSMVVIGILALVTLTGCGEAKTYTLLGEVLVLQEEGITETDQGGCVGTGYSTHIRSSETLTITMANGDEVTTKLGTGAWTPEGNCSFEFVADVPDSDRYAFTLGDLSTVREKKTIGTRIPDDLGHSRDGDWWVTISFQGN